MLFIVFDVYNDNGNDNLYFLSKRIRANGIIVYRK